jgi:CheY-like chemotaxis protein
MNRLSLLLVEDDDALRQLLSHVLEQASHRVTAVANGRSAIGELSAGTFDAVVTDVLMPDADGLEVIAAAKQFQPQAPIIAMSGGSGTLNAGFCLNLAGRLSNARILPKPFLPRELLEAIEGLCAEASALRCTGVAES